MTSATSAGGPVSGALAESLREFVRRHGVVVWLDADGHYSEFAQRLASARASGAVPFDIRTFQGSHLELVLALDGLAAGTERPPLVLHLPGFNSTTVQETPCLELYEGGTNYLKALRTLVTDAAAGRVRPDQIEAFCDQPGLTLEAADAWLAAHLSTGSSGSAAQLRLMTSEAVIDELLRGDGFVGSLVAADAGLAALWEQFGAWTGLPASWRELTGAGDSASADDVAFCIASWALCVEYVNDLMRPPHNAHLAQATGLPRPVTDACGRLAVHLRARHAEFYQRTADETQALLPDEVEAACAEDLGRIDTFRFEEEKVLNAALAALESGSWETAAKWAGQRTDASTGTDSHWLQQDPARRSTWVLVDGAARLGAAIRQAGPQLGETASIDAAADAYAARGAAVDQAHRHLEQRRVALLYPQLPDFAELRACLDRMRQHWRDWADAWARDFNALCRRHGFLPDASRQQRTLFDDVVRPMVQESGTTAYFVIDALRFEMAEELYRLIDGTPATAVHLRARLAELPTVTEVGMNALAPVCVGGRLRPELSSADGGKVLGFSTGQFRVQSPDTRKRAMHDRVGGRDCPWLTLDNVVGRDATSLRKTVARAQLVIVHSLEIDTAGENGVGPAVFDVAMQKLRAAWRLLRDAGVRRFVFTSDHGYLLLDESTGSAQAHGRKIDPKRRHVFSSMAEDHSGEVRVALSDLGYDGVDGHVIFPETTAVFDTGKRSMSFVHGGNTLQERVIPVLTVVHRAAVGGSTLKYRVRAEAREGVAGMHCISIRVDSASQGELDFGRCKDVELALRVPESGDVQVELCQARGSASLSGGAVLAPVGAEFELFFRLTGPTDARVLVELHHPSAVVEVEPFVAESRFEVTASRTVNPDEAAPVAPASGPALDWLGHLPEGAREVFEHLARFGAITESEAAGMLGGPRGARRFARQFDEFVQRAPFRVRIDVVANVKRYVREGNA